MEEVKRKRTAEHAKTEDRGGNTRYLYSDDRCWGPGRWQFGSHLYRNKAEKTIADSLT